jgi:hypothetical protein
MTATLMASSFMIPFIYINSKETIKGINYHELTVLRYTR